MRVCVSCGTQNPDGGRFCISCGTSLVAACGVCGTERPEAARFCPSCGTPFPEDQAPPISVGQERRLVTILFADVSGSTSLGERLDPERLQEVLATYFQAMREEIEAEGGTVEKFIGDAVMAVFGVPVTHEDDPSRALRAALRMQGRLEQVNEELRERFGVELQIRTGVNTGEVLASTEPKPGEPMVTGDAVNVAARLEQTADPGGIVVAERTARAARGFRFRELGPQELRGKEQPVPAVVLQAEAPETPARGVPGLQAPMVGRDQELALLRTLYERSASERRPDLVTIYGDPGVGKSRLTNEFLAWVETQEPRPTVLRGRCLPYGDGITYWPFAEVLKSYAGVLDTDAPEAALDKIRAMGRSLLTEDVAEDPARAAAALAYTVGVEDPLAGFETLEPREVRTKIHAAWRSFFSAIARSGVVVTVIEDIHWADPALLDLLDELAERAQGPVLFVCPARPNLIDRRPGWGGGRRNFSSVSLDPLSPDESDRLITLLLSIEDLPDDVHQAILERAEGNPFFLEEIIRKLIDEQRIVRVGDRWRAGSGLGEVVVPDTVQGVLAARIDLLGPKEKRALQRAAVVGRVFWPGPVARLLNGDGYELEETLTKLEDRELVVSRLGSAMAGQREFIFKHVLTRDVAYESLPRRDRARAHSSVAEWIESTAGERRAEFAELIAYHYGEAHRGRREESQSDPEALEHLRAKAFTALMRASEDARRRFAVSKAAAMAERALVLAGGPIERAAALEQVGRVGLNDYRGDLAWTSFKEAADLRAEHDPDDRMAIVRACADAVESPMRWPGSMKQIPAEEEVRRYFDLGFANVVDENSEAHVRLLLARAFVPFAFAPRRPISDEECEAATEDGERAAEIAIRLGRPELASASLDGVGTSWWVRGLYGPSLPNIQQRMELAQTLENPWELGDLYAVAAWASAMIGDFDEAVRFAKQGVSLTTDQAPGMELHNLSWLALAEFSLGNWSTVVDEILPRVRALLGDRSQDPPYFTMHVYASAAFVHASRDDARAIELLEILHKLSGTPEEQHRHFAPRIWLTTVLFRVGSHQEAQKLLDSVHRVHTQIYRPLLDQVIATALAEQRRFDEVPEFVRRSREYSERAQLRALPVHLDRLEGRSAVAGDDVEAGVEMLEKARQGFEALGATWERAVTELDLAEVLATSGNAERARSLLDEAAPDLERAGALRELKRLWALRQSLA